MASKQGSKVPNPHLAKDRALDHRAEVQSTSAGVCKYLDNVELARLAPDCKFFTCIAPPWTRRWPHLNGTNRRGRQGPGSLLIDRIHSADVWAAFVLSGLIWASGVCWPNGRPIGPGLHSAVTNRKLAVFQAWTESRFQGQLSPVRIPTVGHGFCPPIVPV